MHDTAGFRRQLRHRHAELRRRRLHQHLTRRCAELAHSLVAHAHRHAAARETAAASQKIVGTGRGAFHRKVRRINIQLFADDLRHGGEDALPTFDESAAEQDGAIGANFQKGVDARAGRDGSSGLRPGTSDRHGHRKNERRCATQEAAPRDIERPVFAARGQAVAEESHVVHRSPPQACAACRTAAEIAL